MNYLLDINVVGELRKSAAMVNGSARSWVSARSPETLFISVVTVMELEIGVGRTVRRDRQQGLRLRAWLDERVMTAFEGRVLDVYRPLELRQGVNDHSAEAEARIAWSYNRRQRAVARYYSEIMTRTSQPTRLPADVYDAAVVASAITSRPVAQQIAHWARIGRELEMSPRVNHRAIMQVLAGTGTYDMLGEHEQAIVRQGWAERMTDLRGELSYAAEFAKTRESYSEIDEDGKLVVHAARG